jgi:hypothetical protein
VTPADHRQREPVGSAAEEAARLVEAFQGWWHERPQPESDTAEGASRPAEPDPAEHQPSATCRYCPLCRLMSTAQARRPEVLHHLLATAEAVAALLRELSRPDETGASPADPGAGRRPDVRTVTIPVEPDDGPGREPADEPGGH